MNKFFKLVLTTLLIVFLTLIIIFALIKYKNYKNAKDISNAIHAVVIADYAPFYSRPETENAWQIKTLNKTEKVYILEKFYKDGLEWYKIKVDGDKDGYVRADTVGYYGKSRNEDVPEGSVLIADVSTFNNKTIFRTEEQFIAFLAESRRCIY